MRFGHGQGGIIEITLNANALKRWALSLHKCSHIIKDLVDMKDTNKNNSQVTVHKKEMPRRMIDDAKD